MKKIFPLSFLLLTGVLKIGYAQVVTIFPVFPTVDDSITVIFDATQGNGALTNVAPPIYMHSGVITNQSISPTDWKYVVGNWGKNDGIGEMTTLGNNKYKISYRIRTYYGIPATGVTVYNLAMVFRNADGDNSIKGANADGSDIHYDLWNGALQIKHIRPVGNFELTKLDSAINLKYYASESGTISLYQNGNLVLTQPASDSLGYLFPATQAGQFQLVATVQTTDSSASDTINVIVPSGSAPIAALPPGIKPGINYLDDSTATLCVVAPNKKYIYILGDFNNYIPDSGYYMYMTPDSQDFWKTIHHLIPQKQYTYQYLIDGTIKVGDEYCDEVSDPDNDPFIPASVYPNLPVYPAGKTTGIASVLETAQTPYQWNDAGYVKPDEHNLVIYELLVRDFVATHSYHTLIDTLHYLKQLGVNAIELMPINEFEGNDSWGYNPNYFLAADKYYGPKDSLRRFIDVCHQNGIAVIQDIALDHAFGSCPLVLMYDNASGWPTADNPWLNPDSDPATPGYQAPHPFGVGYDFNHESPYTRRFVLDVCRFWLDQYHMDGFRFDLAKGFTQTFTNVAGDGNDVTNWGHYDQSRIDTWTYYNDSIRKTNPAAYLILEYFADNNEESIIANEGFLPWGNFSCAYQQAAMGYYSGPCGTWDISGISYKNLGGWNSPNEVGYMESHDEERVLYKIEQYGNSSGNYVTKPVDSGLQRMKLCASLFFTVPGPKMFWQFEELGYDYSIDSCANGTFSDDCRIQDKPIRWNYYKDPYRLGLYKWYKALIHLKLNYPNVFNTTNFSISGADTVKFVKLTGDTMDAIAIGNCDVKIRNKAPGFQQTGTWYDYSTSTPYIISNVNQVLTLLPGEYHIFTTKQLPKPDLEVPTGINPITKKAETIPILYDPFPNPATQTVTFTTYTPAITSAKISVYDMNGKLIATLFDGPMLQGIYTTQWDVSKLPQGNYLVQMITALGAQSKKLVIVK